MKKPILVFDLDGTFAHTAPDLLDSLNHCLEIAGLPQADPRDLMKYVGHGGRVMIDRALKARGQAVTPDLLEHLMASFIAHYEANMPGTTKPYDGAVEALDRFSQAGFLLAICTNKFEGMSQKLLKGMGLADRFAAICGQDTFPYKKPDARHLTDTIKLAGGDQDNAVMIGDTITDIDTAKNAGIPVIAVSFGYSDRPVAEYEPSRVIDHFSQLDLPLVERILAASRGR